MSEGELNEVRKRFGILFQSGALLNSMNVGENVALPLQEHTDLDPATIEIMVKIKLELVGLREHADKMPAQLSGGMKKRAGGRPALRAMLATAGRRTAAAAMLFMNADRTPATSMMATRRGISRLPKTR